MADENILSKIKKLLNQADTGKGATEAEADNAMKLAMMLLAKHNLDMSDVQAHEERSGPEIVREFIYSKGGTLAFNWALTCGQVAAKLYFCYHTIARTKKYVGKARMTDSGKITRSMAWTGVYHYFIGRKDNVQTAKEVTEWLIATVMTLGRVETNKERISDPKARTRFEKDFREGCADRLYWRAVALMQKAIEGGVSNLPALIDLDKTTKAENAAFIENKELKFGTTVSRMAMRGVGYQAGVLAAETVSLNHRAKAKKATLTIEADIMEA